MIDKEGHHITKSKSKFDVFRVRCSALNTFLHAARSGLLEEKQHLPESGL